MQIKSVSWQSIEFLKPSLGKAPETLNTVNVIRSVSKLIRAVRNTKMLFKAYINQPVITAPFVE